jgi:hypothetical protein
VQGQVDENAAPVGVVGAAVHDPFGHHAVHKLGERRCGQHRRVGDLGHVVAPAVGEQLQHAPLLERAVLRGENLGHAARQEPLGTAQLMDKISRRFGHHRCRALLFRLY